MEQMKIELEKHVLAAADNDNKYNLPYSDDKENSAKKVSSSKV